MTDQDLNMLALGCDLSSLGLNINSTEPLHTSFHLPWSDARHNLDYILPSCYNVQPPPSAVHKIHAFSDETLFYIFYSMPRDALQEAAANELHQRSWKYHKELKLWFMKDPSVELTAKTPNMERGTFIFFDVSRWEKVKKEHVIAFEHVEDWSNTSNAR
ncbi:hypothetical protein ROZALSC1DRAFT_26941 [Rozella allomycis CSF55]|uniref:NOT2/NOT3/NOT5 domain-containing protein n=1 Tax=Rozella allomycis (strain CSF55) TaxID=988480 RepID=A0A075B3Y7_ROZAC|nr:NOT2/NOT3/NOT5 domain-containing protein [Rozella allomycis CSF55]RKP21655.1 hypothetical protein ROZALSC1DRAFT_26941 [Rozella allomycis CSF55]|eukprot:EPZ35877.1 NOT2/NOT3/NOT5 domain-containing protein [Rozella allomycis CSF55]